MKRHLHLVLVLLTLMSTTIFACGSPSTPGGPESPSKDLPKPIPDSLETPETVDPGASESPYEELLRAIPDTPEAREAVYIEDYALARQIFADVAYMPGPEDDEAVTEEFYDWLPPMSFRGDASDPPILSFGRRSFLSPYRHMEYKQAKGMSYTEYLAFSQQVAFDVRNVDRVAVTEPGTLVDVLEVATGRFDPKTIDNALESCSECPTPSLGEHGGISYYSWGEDLQVNKELRMAPPVFDRYGRGGRISVLDDYVLRAYSTANLEALINAYQDNRPSLADAEEFRLLAQEMSQLGAYTMLLSDNTFGPDMYRASPMLEGLSQGEQDRILAKLAEPVPLRPYQAFATGAGKDDAGPYMALVLVHADGGSAEENVTLLRQRIDEGTGAVYSDPWSKSIDEAEINADGRLLIAKIRGRVAISPYEWVINRDNLILHE